MKSISRMRRETGRGLSQRRVCKLDGMDPYIIVLLSGISSVVGGVIVAFLGLRFQHLVWRKQKLSEQRV
jgi:membrane protein YqaA with SNARE-associated domain